MLRMVAPSKQARMAMNPKCMRCRFMYKPEDRSPDVQQKLRVSNALTIGQVRRMPKAHGNNYYESEEQRTANPRGTESPVRGSSEELKNWEEETDGR